MLRNFLILISLFAGIFIHSAFAQSNGADHPLSSISQRAFTEQMLNWEKKLARARALLVGDKPVEEIYDSNLALLKNITAQANGWRSDIESEMRAVQNRLDVLGPAPDPKAAPETRDIAKKRAELEREINEHKSRIAKLDLILTESEELEKNTVKVGQDRLVQEVTKKFPAPFAPNTLAVAVPDFFAQLDWLVGSPQRHWNGIPEDKRDLAALYPQFLVLLATGVLALFIRGRLLNRFGPKADEIPLERDQKTAAAMAAGIANGLVPASVLAGGFYPLSQLPESSDGFLVPALYSLLSITIGLVLVIGVAHAILAPKFPAWRLFHFSAASSVKLETLVVVLAIVFAFDLFQTSISVPEQGPFLVVSNELRSLSGTILVWLEGILVVLLLRPKLWQRDADDHDDLPAHALGGFLVLVRRLLTLSMIAGLLVALTGYTNLARAMVTLPLVSALPIGFIFLLRALVHEAGRHLLKTRLMVRSFGVGERQTRSLLFWGKLLFEPIFLMAAVFMVVPLWGIPHERLIGWLKQLVSGVKIGDITLSAVDILVAIGVFFAAMTVTRLLQRLLAERILPETNLQTGAQYAVSAGAGYFGVVVAGALSVAALGINLESLALVAGALSVGIGFGLQNIVSNFVSGFILLIERPIKVGDWVVVGDQEGIVKRINFRATEVETFQGAAVLVPNSSLLSNALVNWTHNDTRGRIEVQVGVEYGSDTARVRDILLEVAKAHPEVTFEPAPFVLFRSFGASSLDFELRCFTLNIGMRGIYASELRFEIDRRFRQEGINIPFNQTVLHFADDKSTDVPEAKKRLTRKRPSQSIKDDSDL